jgi:endonuclease G, mitochondrial
MRARVWCIFVLLLASYLSFGQPQDTDVSKSEAIRTHVPFGFPGSHGQMLDRKYYIVSYRTEAKVPEWTAYRLVKKDLVDRATRTDDFRADTELPAGDRAEKTDYAQSGFAQGHMSPADDFTRSLTAMSSTFLLSNMAPQHGSLNSGKWRTLEGNAQSVARALDTCWILTGTIFDRSASRPRTLGTKPNGSQRTIGKGKVWVPTHYYKIIFAHDADGSPLIWAFMMPHRNAKLPGKVVDYAVSVDSIERLTNLDFFPQLPDDLENRLESGVNKTWPIK